MENFSLAVRGQGGGPYVGEAAVHVPLYVDIASSAAPLGIELFVMDDGWFGTRDSDLGGLGD